MNWALSFFGGKSVYAGAQIRVDLAVAKVGCAPRFSGISCSLERISVVFGLLYFSLGGYYLQATF